MGKPQFFRFLINAAGPVFNLKNSIAAIKSGRAEKDMFGKDKVDITCWLGLFVYDICQAPVTWPASRSKQPPLASATSVGCNGDLKCVFRQISMDVPSVPVSLPPQAVLTPTQTQPPSVPKLSGCPPPLLPLPALRPQSPNRQESNGVPGLLRGLTLR